MSKKRAMNPIRKATAVSRTAPSHRERWLSAVLLTALIVIAVSVVAIHFRYDPALWRDHGAATAQAGTASEAQWLSRIETANLPGLKVMSLPEVYDAQTLSDKINGKAELYLPAGFERLECRRFALADDPLRWMELFVYDMGDRNGAFAVYSQQRREQSRPLELTEDAYLSSNGIFLVQGRFYLEIIGSDSSDALVQKMIGVARTFVELHPAAEAAIDERSLFPEEGRVADSIALTPENVFGFDAFNRIYSAEYRHDGQTATAFISRRDSEAQAAELVEAYIAYLLEYGGTRIDPPDGAPPVVIIEILDMIEIVFHQGDILAGIHEADDLSHALDLAGRLRRKIQEASHAP
jgi:hypothetical protein